MKHTGRDAKVDLVPYIPKQINEFFGRFCGQIVEFFRVVPIFVKLMAMLLQPPIFGSVKLRVDITELRQ
jgi:hypothetical protein